ncbi:hypothetical protein AC1031_017908 [Aphanomyces cochlioides]|nr:hypothetical protein AC1031_017908 [Aphanomyces cochlioides]
MLDQVEDIKPLGKNGWLRVERAFNASHFVPRDADALKRMFVTLKNHPKPTGDPDCPPEVARAKRICRQLDNHAAVLPLSDDPDVDVGNHSIDDNSIAEEDDEERTSLPTHQREEQLNRTGVARNELIELSKELRNSNGSLLSDTTSSSSTMSYTAKKRRALDKFIDGAMQTKNESSEFMSLIMLMDERAAAREERRIEQEEAREERRLMREFQWQRELLERQLKADEERSERERRRDEMQMALFGKLFGMK